MLACRASLHLLLPNVVMKPWIAILTGLHVLAHGVFGCCDHSLAASARAPKSCSCHHQAHPSDHHAHSSCPRELADEEESPSPAPHQCIHASCHWLSGDAEPNINLLDLSAPVALVVIVPIDRLATHAAEFWPDNAARGNSALPLRLHLALGVLLI